MLNCPPWQLMPARGPNLCRFVSFQGRQFVACTSPPKTALQKRSLLGHTVSVSFENHFCDTHSLLAGLLVCCRPAVRQGRTPVWAGVVNGHNLASLIPARWSGRVWHTTVFVWSGRVCHRSVFVWSGRRARQTQCLCETVCGHHLARLLPVWSGRVCVLVCVCGGGGQNSATVRYFYWGGAEGAQRQ